MQRVNTIVTIGNLQSTYRYGFKAFRSVKPAAKFLMHHIEKYGKDSVKTRMVDYSRYSGNAKDKRIIVNTYKKRYIPIEGDIVP